MWPARLGAPAQGKLGFKRAAVAVARKLAVIMHAMLVSGQRFDRTIGLTAATN
jgi:transposase